MGTCYCTVGGGRRLMLTRLRPEPVPVLAFRGLVSLAQEHHHIQRIIEEA